MYITAKTKSNPKHHECTNQSIYKGYFYLLQIYTEKLLIFLNFNLPWITFYDTVIKGETD